LSAAKEVQEQQLKGSSSPKGLDLESKIWNFRWLPTANCLKTRLRSGFFCLKFSIGSQLEFPNEILYTDVQKLEVYAPMDHQDD